MYEVILAFKPANMNPEKFALKHKLSIQCADEFVELVVEIVSPELYADIKRYRDTAHRVVWFVGAKERWEKALASLTPGIAVLYEHEIKTLHEWCD